MGCCCSNASKKESAQDSMNSPMGGDEQGFFSSICRCQRSVVPAIMLRVLFSLAIGVIATSLWFFQHNLHFHYALKTGSDGHKYVGVLIIFVLVFRTNAAYNMYAQGVSAIFDMKHKCVNFIAQSLLVVVGPEEATRNIRYRLANLMIVLFVVAKKSLHEHEDDLEGSITSALCQERLDYLNSQEPMDRCSIIISWIRVEMASAAASNNVVIPLLTTLDNNLAGFMHDYNVCTRIKKAHTPFPYSQMVKIGLLMYVTISPFAYVNDVQLMTPFVNVLIGFMMFGVEQIAAEIEDPFGKDPNDIRIKPFILSTERDIIAMLNTVHYKNPFKAVYGQYETFTPNEDENATASAALLDKAV